MSILRAIRFQSDPSVLYLAMNLHFIKFTPTLRHLILHKIKVPANVMWHIIPLGLLGEIDSRHMPGGLYRIRS